MKFIIVFYIILTATVFAHEGPAYPILVDHKIIGLTSNNLELESRLSLWADPDTGMGTFSFYLEANNFSSFLRKKDQLDINILTYPANDITHILKGIASLDQKNSGAERLVYVAKIPFDLSTKWDFEISLSQNGRLLSNIKIPVDVTPPGPNRLEFIIAFLPFLLVGLVWIKVVIYKRKKSSAHFSN